MGYTNVALKDKIMEMYPDIEKFKLAVSLDFDKEKNAYIVKLKKSGKELTTHLGKKGCRRLHGRHQVRLSRRAGRAVHQEL